MSKTIKKVVDSEELENKVVTEGTEVKGLEAFEALVETNEAFDEDFKTKSAVIFESALNAKKKELEEAAKLKKEEEDKEDEEEKGKEDEKLQESINDYLTYAVEEWIKDNAVAIDSSLKTSISEDFMSGLKGLFEEHYVEVPEGKIDLLEEASDKNALLATQLEDSNTESKRLADLVEDFQRKEIVTEATKDMTDSQKEKFGELVESVDFNTAEKFKKKVIVLSESFDTSTDDKTVTEELGDDGKVVVEDTTVGDEVDKPISDDPTIAAAVKALGNKKMW